MQNSEQKRQKKNDAEQRSERASHGLLTLKLTVQIMEPWRLQDMLEDSSFPARATTPALTSSSWSEEAPRIYIRPSIFLPAFSSLVTLVIKGGADKPVLVAPQWNRLLGDDHRR
eukprot:scaffold95038_cov16-Prasinocladus_malaysianus.AAC.1